MKMVYERLLDFIKRKLDLSYTYSLIQYAHWTDHGVALWYAWTVTLQTYSHSLRLILSFV